ncbi:MAG: outer membrane beta-barrel protein [Verrucomicrobiaceae bacterium]
MKIKFFSLVGILAISSQMMAGTMAPAPQMQQPMMSQTLFGPGFTIGGHALFVTPKGDQGSTRAWGGGLNADYFFNSNVGLGFSADWARPNSTTFGAYTADLVVRMPFEAYHIAPYILGGIGAVHANDNGDRTSTEFLFRAGAGLELRMNSKFGIFSDYSWNWPTGDTISNYGMFRVGVKFGF